MKNVFCITSNENDKIMLILSKKKQKKTGDFVQYTFKFTRYKKVVLYETPKISFSDMNKLQKSTKK